MSRPRNGFRMLAFARKARPAGFARCLYGLPEARQPVICPGRIPAARATQRAPSMDSFELNKILGAVLFTCLVLLALNIAAGAPFTPEPPKKPGYENAVQEEPRAAPPAGAPPPPPRQPGPAARPPPPARATPH